MSFKFPFGLLLLLAIPVLIIIYIIKNRYKEKVTSSSYIWELSKKFLKKKNPLNTISNLLNLIVQCFCIAFLSFSLADPVLNFKNGAENEVYILDSSASMGIENEDGLTRFEKAKELIKEDVENATSGSTFTLVVSDSNSRTICKNIEDKDIFNSILSRVEIDYGESELKNAISLAQSLSSEGEGSKFSLYTDKEVKVEDGLETFNVADTSKNYAISDLRVSAIEENETPAILLEADVNSFNEDTELEVEFFLNDESLKTVKGEVKKNELATLSLKITDNIDKFANYSSIKAQILNEDYLKEDSEFIIYNSTDFDTTSVLIVSNSPFYFESVFKALSYNNTRVSYAVIPPMLYSFSGGTVAYDIVIFDGYSPEKLPTDSAVWLFNCGESIPDSGFYVQKEYTVEDPGIKASYANNTDDLSYDNLPFIFAGRNEFNQKEIVFNFDLHNSNLPLLADFIILMRNCITYSNPLILTDFNYNVNDKVTFTFPDTAINCEITTPSGKEEYLSAIDIETYTLNEVGTYSVNVDLATGKSRKINIFSAFPLEERNPNVVEENTYSIVLNTEVPKADRIFEALLVVVIISLILLLADWMLYSHEQF